MKKIILPIAIAVVILSSFTLATLNYRKVKNNAFDKGEHIEYSAHYGFFTIGEGTVNVSEKNYLVNKRVCYRIDVNGKTTNLTGMIVDVKDLWRTYIDTSALIPHRFYRKVKEGNYNRKEITDFSHLTKKAVMKYESFNGKTPEKKNKEKKTFKIPKYAQDMISGYYYLRTINFSKKKKGDIITIPGLLEDKLYDLKIRFRGKEEIKTKFGKIMAYRLAPIMPDSDTYKGKDAVRFWISADKNKVPLKVEADMFVGKIVLNMKKYRNLKHKFSFKK